MGQVNLYKIEDSKQKEFAELLSNKYEFIGEQEYKSISDKNKTYIVGTYLFCSDNCKKPDWQWILDEYDHEEIKIYSSPRAILKIEA